MTRVLTLIIEPACPGSDAMVKVVGERGVVTNEFVALDLASAMARLGGVLDSEARADA